MSWKNEYPRPQLKRNSFLSLNGQWKMNDQQVNVPYPPQCSLSGFEGDVPDSLVYERFFILPEDFYRPGQRVLLHFGAVDQIADVFLNGRPVKHHEGGYLPFSCDITDFLRKGENELVLAVLDILSHDFPYGKQSKKRGGMWYTPVSGIWQSVWMEAVSPGYIKNIRITPDLHGVTLVVESNAGRFTAAVPGETTVTGKPGEAVRLEIAHPRLWSPEDPHLYDLRIETADDAVTSYFALRTVEVLPDANGVQRICLNGKPVFLAGVLDQGYFEDGIYLPEDPSAYENDIQHMKAMGFNMLRKHIKVEPEAYYYACDRLGMLVMQDMVNSGSYNFFVDTALPTIGLKKLPDHFTGTRKRKDFFIQHSRDTIAHVYNHPCVVGYTIFNEGWGQFDADNVYRVLKQEDPTRFFDATSGWFTRTESDVDSQHVYFRNKVLKGNGRPLLLSECGGYARPIPGHLFNPDGKYGYGTETTKKGLMKRLHRMAEEMLLPSIPGGLNGYVYTQVSDVEDEINGLYTYDREVCKVDAEEMRAINESVTEAFNKACEK